MERNRLTRRLLVVGVLASTVVLAVAGCSGSSRLASAPHPAAAAAVSATKSSGLAFASSPMMADIRGFTSEAGFHSVGVTAAPRSCSLTAVPGAPRLSQPSSLGYPPSEVPPTGFSAATQASAVLWAHDAAAKYTGTPAPATSPTAVTEESYSAYLTSSGHAAEDPRIDPARCVWVVVVDSTITIPHPPDAHGSTRSRPLSQYSTVVDAATHFPIEFSATP